MFSPPKAKTKNEIIAAAPIISYRADAALYQSIFIIFTSQILYGE